MDWWRILRWIAVGGTYLVAVAFLINANAGQNTAASESSSATYAIPLKDGNVAVVWWDAVSDPAHPVWRCEVRAPRAGDAAPATTVLTAAAGDWRAALAEAREHLKGRVADAE